MNCLKKPCPNPQGPCQCHHRRRQLGRKGQQHPAVRPAGGGQVSSGIRDRAGTRPERLSRPLYADHRPDLVQKLQQARRDLALESAIAKLDKFHLLILDDIT